MLNNRHRAAIYVRVSSEMQVDNYSLDAQESACQSFAALRGWQVVHTYREEGASAKSIERPEFQQLLRDARAGLFDVVIVHKLDRFSRKLKDMIELVDLFDEIDVALVSATEQFDLSTPQGKMMVNVMSSVNQWYLDNLSQEITKGKRQRARSGDWNGTLSYGYITPKQLRDELANLSNELRVGNLSKGQFQEKAGLIEDTLDKYPEAHDTAAVPCPFQSQGVVFAFEQYATGQYSFTQIAVLLNDDGYICNSRDGTGLFKKEMAGEMLRNRFYLGQTSYGARVKGKSRQWMDGNHDALISQELFDKCQVVRKTFSNKRKAHNRARPYPLTPMLVCIEQGIQWRGQTQSGSRRYLRSKNNGISGTHVKADELENELIQYLSSIEFPKEWKQIIIKNLEDNKGRAIDPKPLRAKLERLKKLFVLGHITENEYLEQYNTIQDSLSQSHKRTIISVGDIETIENITKNLYSIWENATLEEKDNLAKMLFHKIYMRGKKIAVVEPTAILSEIIRDTERTGFEPA